MDMVQKCLAFLTISSLAVVLGLYFIGTCLNCLGEPLKVLIIKFATCSEGHISVSRYCSLNLKGSAESAVKNDSLTQFYYSSVNRTGYMAKLMQKGIFKNA